MRQFWCNQYFWHLVTHFVFFWWVFVPFLCWGLGWLLVELYWSFGCGCSWASGCQLERKKVLNINILLTPCWHERSNFWSAFSMFFGDNVNWRLHCVIGSFWATIVQQKNKGKVEIFCKCWGFLNLISRSNCEDLSASWALDLMGTFKPQFLQQTTGIRMTAFLSFWQIPFWWHFGTTC